MYFPFLYGKQFELLAIRDFSTQVSPNYIFPIIEPVKNNFNSLKLACDALCSNRFKFVVIINPSCGDFAETSNLINRFLDESYKTSPYCYKGLLVSQKTTFDEVCRVAQDSESQYFLIHDAISNQFSKILDFLKNENHNIVGHVFYRKNIPDIKISKLKKYHKKCPYFVCLQDGFNKMKNADYPPEEFFSDQHIVYSDLFTGFSDYLIAGREYSENGGPAFAVTIHLTFLDKSDDDIMRIFHFVSDSTESSKDPAGKFEEALNKMMQKIQNPPNGVELNTLAIQEFKRLYATRHYPGLGFLKKLSMLHHIQILNQYLQNEDA